MTVQKLTDRSALDLHRRRADRIGEHFLAETAASEIEERLGEVNRTFTSPLIVTGQPEPWRAVLPRARVIGDDAVLDVEEGAHDLVLHALALHWADDPLGQIIQARRALRPDGLFLAVTFGGQTLHELRRVLAATETQLDSGLSPRVAPMGEIRDLGALLQRGGFALPVADTLTLPVTYSSLDRLVADLRAMGETNALAARERRPLTRKHLRLAEQLYRDHFGTADGRIVATFELVFLTGWAPAPNQQAPLRPGSAAARLADALGAEELGAGDPASIQSD